MYFTRVPQMFNMCFTCAKPPRVTCETMWGFFLCLFLRWVSELDRMGLNVVEFLFTLSRNLFQFPLLSSQLHTGCIVVHLYYGQLMTVLCRIDKTDQYLQSWPRCQALIKENCSLIVSARGLSMKALSENNLAAVGRLWSHQHSFLRRALRLQQPPWETLSPP